MLKIRRPLGRLIFNMGIAIPGKTVFLIETAPWLNRRCCWAWVNNCVPKFHAGTVTYPCSLADSIYNWVVIMDIVLQAHGNRDILLQPNESTSKHCKRNCNFENARFDTICRLHMHQTYHNQMDPQPWPHVYSWYTNQPIHTSIDTNYFCLDL